LEEGVALEGLWPEGSLGINATLGTKEGLWAEDSLGIKATLWIKHMDLRLVDYELMFASTRKFLPSTWHNQRIAATANLRVDHCFDDVDLGGSLNPVVECRT
jgi:hypothetical protein